MNSSKTQKRKQTQKRTQKQKTRGGYISNINKPTVKSTRKNSRRRLVNPKKSSPSPVANALLLPKIMNTF